MSSSNRFAGRLNPFTLLTAAVIVAISFVAGYLVSSNLESQTNPPATLVDSRSGPIWNGYGEYGFVFHGLSVPDGVKPPMLLLGAPREEGKAEKCVYPVVLDDAVEACQNYRCINKVFDNEPTDVLNGYGQRGMLILNCNAKEADGVKPDLLLNDNGHRVATNIRFFYPSLPGHGEWWQGEYEGSYSVELGTEAAEGRLLYDGASDTYRWDEYGEP